MGAGVSSAGSDVVPASSAELFALQAKQAASPIKQILIQFMGISFVRRAATRARGGRSIRG
jgi:hypothetical protein